MTLTPIDQSRTQPTVDTIFNNAHAHVAPKRRHDGVVVRRPRGQRGSGHGLYDFGNRISVPCVVVNGVVKRLG